jgi:hypothetical protein
LYLQTISLASPYGKFSFSRWVNAAFGANLGHPSTV